MAPRPRNSANKHLPQNLYFDPRRSTYRYRRPSDGKWFQFGTDRIRAIDAAKQLNLAFMQGADLVRSVMGNASGSFAGFLDKYEAEILPPRELAKGTLGLYAVHFRRFRKHFEGKAVDQITIRMVAELLDTLTQGAPIKVALCWWTFSIMPRPKAYARTTRHRAPSTVSRRSNANAIPWKA